MQITPSSLTINQLFGSLSEQYIIPTYQRRYSWQDRQIWELIEDIQLIESGDTHLLGSIVCLTGHHTAGLNKLELVDGQQRLTTITILLMCISERLHNDNEKDAATEIDKLLTAKPLGGVALSKVALDSIDTDDFSKLLKNDLTHVCGNKRLKTAFGTIREWVSEKSLEDLDAFLYRLREQSKVIRLDVSEAKDAFKLFETINNRGLRLSPTDIVKNFLLGNSARFGAEALQLARTSWAKLIVHLDDVNSDAFFRYYLMAFYQTQITASQVVVNFKYLFMSQVVEASALPDRHQYVEDETQEDDGVDDLDASTDVAQDALKNNTYQVSFQSFLTNLVLCAKVYGELVSGKTGDKRIDRHLRNLRMIKAVQTYGFLMHLRVGGCKDQRFREVLQLTENFVLRRHICRERSNDTEALFARMCEIKAADPIEQTKKAYAELCPSNDKFREEFASATFPANLIDRARYCLERIELEQHGDHAELQVLGAEDVHVEHIIPQKIKTKRAKEEFGDWVTYLGAKAEEQHPKYVSRIGNLTLFAGTLNISASNNPFGMKKQAYKDSGIKLTQALLSMPSFKYKNVDLRSSKLAETAVKLWPLP